MRVILLTGMMSMMAAAVQAGSIDVVKTNDSTRSIDYIVCSNCAPVKSKEVEVPEVTLEPGTQKIEFREVNGEMKIFRTEAWLGGSPVTYVSKASTEQVNEHNAAVAAADEHKSPTVIVKDVTSKDVSSKDNATASNDDQKANGVAIDPNTTSAVNADVSGNPPEVTMIKKFNPQDLKLRLE